MKRGLLYILLPMLAVAGCYKEARDKINRIHGLHWSGTYAISAINADLNLDDAIEIVSGPANTGAYLDKIIYFAYKADEISKKGSDIYPLNDQNGNTSASLTVAERNTLNTTNTVTSNRSFVFPFTMNGIPELDSIWFSSGQFSLNFQNNYDHPCNAVVNIIDERRRVSGQGNMTYSFSIPARGNSNIGDTLGKVMLDLTKGGTGFNELRIDMQLTWTNSGAGFTVSDNFSVTYNFNNLKFERLYGYFGNNNILNANDSLELNIFSNGLKYGSFSFEDPRLKLIYSHDFGMPFQMQVNSLIGHKPGSDNTIIGYPANTSIAAIPAGNEGQSMMDSLVITHPSSNIQSVIKNEPTHILYNFNIQPNPAGKTRNFILANSTFKVTVVMELPMNGLATKVLLSDTTTFNLNAGNASDVIEWISFRINIHNEIPVTLGFQGYFMDDNYVILDSLFQPFRYLANSANIDGSGNVTSPYDEIYDVRFEKDKIQNMQKATNLMFNAYMNTAESGGTQVPVRITQNQHLKVKLGIHTNLTLNEEF